MTLDVEGLPVIRQWFVLAPQGEGAAAAGTMLDFLSAKGAQFLPRTHGRFA